MTEPKSGIPVHVVGDPDPLERGLANVVAEQATAIRFQYPVYVASTMNHRMLLRGVRRSWRPHNLVIISSWIDEGDNHDDCTPLQFAGKWITNYREVSEAKALVVYVEKRDVLRGALVEAGIALGQHKPVILVGDPHHPSFGSWQYHPLTHAVPDLEAARAVIQSWHKR